MRSSAYLFPEMDVADLGSPPENIIDMDPIDLDRWAQAHGAIDGPFTDISITIQGKESKPVVITNLRARILERRPPVPSGVVIPPRGAGPIVSRAFEVNLDRTPPTLDYFNGEEGDNKPIVFPYKVSDTEPEVFLVLATANKCDCLWELDLSWAAAGQTGVTVINNDGVPFRTSSIVNATSYIPKGDRWKRGEIWE
nr:hypothetical protein GCM10020093_063560 [Planobispora longispora]